MGRNDKQKVVSFRDAVINAQLIVFAGRNVVVVKPNGVASLGQAIAQVLGKFSTVGPSVRNKDIFQQIHNE